MQDVETLCQKVFTEDVKTVIAEAVIKGRMEVEKLYNKQVFLSTVTAKDPKPYIRRVAIDYFLLQLEKIDPVFKCFTVSNAGKNCSHVEVVIQNPAKNILLTQNSISDPSMHPRDAVYRKGLEQKAQLSFKDDDNVLSLPSRKELQRQELCQDYIYGQLCYGGDELLEFVFVGILDKTNYDWKTIIKLPNRGYNEKPANEIQTKNPLTLKTQEKVESEKDEE
jgi:hypothetical protein